MLVILCNLTLVNAASERCAHLQIVSEVYKKQPYIQVPTAWIEPTLRNEILQIIQNSIGPDWQAKHVYFKKGLDGIWIDSLKCHPAANIKIFKKDEEQKTFAILLLYPQSYRDFIEDPLVEVPPPVVYLGSAKRVAFYYFPKDRVYDKLVEQIVAQLKLQKS